MYILKININPSLREGCLVLCLEGHLGPWLQGLLLLQRALVVFDVFEVDLDLLEGLQRL